LKLCNGCILPPTDDYIEDFFKKCHLAIEWHSSLIEEEYNHQANEVLHHSSTSIKDEKEADYVNLEDCLRKFHEVEDLGTNDNIHCPRC
jgi:ubiquitin C-terminal hydrolase